MTDTTAQEPQLTALNQPPWWDRRLQRTDRPLSKIHLDFHNTPFVGAVGEAFDAAEFVATLAAAHVEAIVVFAKDMHGWFYYPAARSEAVHPGLSRDLLGEQVKACRDAGIRVYAYYCFAWDNLLAEQHPDWLAVKRDRTNYLPKFDETPGWTGLCLRNEDFLRCALDDSADLLRRYELDGIWYDMPFPVDGECFCHLCLASLRERGLDPLDVDVQRVDKQQLWVDWQRRSAELVAAVRPGCEVDQNNNTRLGLGERVPYMSNVDIEALPTGGWGYQYFPVDVRFARTLGAPVTGMTGRFALSWADFGGLKGSGQLEVEMAQIVAQGAQVCVGDQPPPSARLDAAVYDRIGAGYAHLDVLRPFLEGAAPLVEAAVVVSGQMLADPGRIEIPGLPLEPAVAWSHSVVGAAELLLAHRVQFDVVEPGPDLGRYRLLVVPDRTVVDDILADLLLAHLESGGAVIAAGQALQREDGTSWSPGVQPAGRSPYSVPFLLPEEALAGRLSPFPYALYRGADQYRVEGATVLARLGVPLFERTPEHWTSHSYAPLRERTDYALAWHRGRLGGLGFDVGSDHLSTGYWVYAEVFGAVLDAVLPERLVRADLPGPVEISLTRQRTDKGPRTLVHLVPSFAERRWGSRLETYAAPVTLADVVLSVDLDHPVRSARRARSSDPVKLSDDNGRVRLELDRLRGPDLVVLE